jgi:hypothetical protein
MNLQSSWMSSKISKKTTSHLGHCHAGKTWTLCFPSAVSRTEEWGVLDCSCCDRTHARRTILLSWWDRPVTIPDHISRAYSCSARDRSWCHMHTWTCRPRLDVVLLATLDDYASIPHAGDCREYNDTATCLPAGCNEVPCLSYQTIQCNGSRGESIRLVISIEIIWKGFYHDQWSVHEHWGLDK